MSRNGYLLLVEDEPLVQENNRMILERRGYSIRQAYTLAEAWAKIVDEPPFAIVLDIQLPDGNGMSFLEELRETSNIPVLMLTAMGTADDIVRGLEAGCDDYLTKPYELPVFLARVEALVRRASSIPEKLIVGPITIDMASNRAFINDEDMGLQQKELSLLLRFMQNPDKTMNVEDLYKKVWGQEMLDNKSAIRKAISKLRYKLEGSGFTITSLRGEGYYFEKD